MNVIDRYKFEENGGEISLMPNYNFLRTLVWWLALGILALVAICYYYSGQWSGGYFKIAMVIWIVYMTYFLFDLIFRVPVKYIFDKSQKCIYKKLFFSKKIMDFDEMVYFVNRESGTHYYAIGKKRNQLVKNYRISNYFSGSKASNRREDEYIEKILYPILNVVGALVNQR